VRVEGNQAFKTLKPFPIPLAEILQSGISDVGISTKSVFGQARWKILPELELAGGARYTDEVRDYIGTDFTTGVAIPVPVLVPTVQSHTVSPEVTLTYKPTDDLTFFGSLKRGFKSGSFDTATPPTLIPPPGLPQDKAFGDEKVQGGEIGMKSRWLDHRLDVELTAYDYRYSGLQVGAIIPVAGAVPVTRTINAGAALVYGLEGKVIYDPPEIEGLTLHAAADWNRGRFKTLNNVPCYGGQSIAAGCNEVFSTATGGFTAQNQSGLAMVRAPDWQVNFGFDYEMSINSDLTFVFSNNTQYSSKYVTGLGAVFYQPAFFKTNVSMTLQIDDDTWEVAFIGKDLNDELTTGNCSNSNARGGLLGFQSTGGSPLSFPGLDVGPDTVGCWMDRGRELWLQVTYKFRGGEPAPATTPYVPPPPAPPAVARSYMVFFDFDKSDLTPDAVKIVDQAAANAAPAKATTITVTGHTDTVGSDAYNMRLGKRRAESVAAQLEKDGIPSSEIVLISKGKRDLLVPTKDGVREPQNRRVTIVYDGGPMS
jgi:outer membrane protein OmpA-like peptidoglycan-associated protein/outer membrane receptor protein involved in Fe transport